MANRAIGGVLSFDIGGLNVEARGDFTVSGFHSALEGVAGQDRVHGYIETPQVPTISGTITTVAGFRLDAVQGIKNVSAITLNLRNDTTYVLTEAWETGQGELNAGEGSLGVTFQGMEGVQTR
ncbi:MAG: phage tail tube protein [Pseudomonadota bacterium]